MGKSSKKPRGKISARSSESSSGPKKKKEQDWSFDDIARSKTRRY